MRTENLLSVPLRMHLISLSLKLNEYVYLHFYCVKKYSCNNSICSQLMKISIVAWRNYSSLYIRKYSYIDLLHTHKIYPFRLRLTKLIHFIHEYSLSFLKIFITLRLIITFLTRKDFVTSVFYSTNISLILKK